MTTAQSYHCICSTFILATNYDLSTQPRRSNSALDKAVILPTKNPDSPDDHQVIIQNLVADRKPTVIRREDGFEKRTLLRCQRCELVVGYYLDQAQFKSEDVLAPDVVYILPGGLLSTEGMMDDKTPVQPEWAAQKV